MGFLFFIKKQMWKCTDNNNNYILVLKTTFELKRLCIKVD